VEFPLHCTANGKAWQDLEIVRQKGVAYDREEHMLGIYAVGAVVYAPIDTVAAISIPGVRRELK